MEPWESNVLELAESTFEGSLQSVTTFGPSNYNRPYFRDDLEAAYSQEELDEIYEALVLEGIGWQYLQELFVAGDLVSSVWVFERSVMFFLVTPGLTGAFVTVDPDVINGITAFIDQVDDAITESAD